MCKYLQPIIENPTFSIAHKKMTEYTKGYKNTVSLIICGLVFAVSKTKKSVTNFTSQILPKSECNLIQCEVKFEIFK